MNRPPEQRDGEAARDVRALVFDLDGTLVNTMPLHWEAWQQVLRRHGLQFSERRFYSLGGVPARDILRLLADEQGVVLDPRRVAREKAEAYLVLLPRVRPLPAILDVACQNRGRLPQAIATGGTRSVVEQVLDHLGIREWFDAVVTSEDVPRQKPAPDIYLEAARRLGVPPGHCRAYEDTDLGLQAIRAAGMDAVDVRPILARERECQLGS